MSMTDRVSDLLTRIRNGQRSRLYSIVAPHSRLCENILKVLKEEGYIVSYSKQTENNKHYLEVQLKYISGNPVIFSIDKVSRPGRRNYSKISDLKKHYNGLGIFILSTPKGVICDYQARKENVGGEVLCSVF